MPPLFFFRHTRERAGALQVDREMTTRSPTLIDAYMPSYDVRARHATRIRASAAATYEVLKRTDLAGSPIVRLLFAIRGLPARVGRPPGRPRIMWLAAVRAAAERGPGASRTSLTGAIPSPGVTAAEGESRGRTG